MDSNLVTVRKISQVIILEFLLSYQKKGKNPILFLFTNPFISSSMETMQCIIKVDKSVCPLVIIEPWGKIKQDKKMGSFLYPNFKMGS